jgi:HEAT repeat protein
LVFITAIGIGLAGWNAWNSRRDMGLALGTEGEAQRAFFREAADRPDIFTFFKGLTPEQKRSMAANIARYDDPPIAKLAATLLSDFDVEARRSLGEAMTKAAGRDPKAVAEQMKIRGSFPQLAITAALRMVGDRALPLVAEQLKVADARTNAGAYLVEAGPASIPVLMPYLQEADRDVRVAAADALGKLRAREAREPLTAMYLAVRENLANPNPENKPEDIAPKTNEANTYLAAVAGIGDPASEALLTELLNNPNLATPQRVTAALGLGRIASPTAIATLRGYVASPDLQLANGTVDALRVSGDVAIQNPDRPSAVDLEIARGVRSARARSVILGALADPNLRLAALRAAENRTDLVPELRDLAATIDPSSSGDEAAALVRTLQSTDEGLQDVARLAEDPRWVGFVRRYVPG